MVKCVSQQPCLVIHCPCFSLLLQSDLHIMHEVYFNVHFNYDWIIQNSYIFIDFSFSEIAHLLVHCYLDYHSKVCD